MGWFSKKKLALALGMVLVLVLTVTVAKGQTRLPFLEKATFILLAPFQYVFSSLGHGLRATGTQVDEIWSVYEENQRLKEANEQLQRERTQLLEVQAENIRLKLLLDYKTSSPQFDLVVAKVIARDASSWTGTLRINRGLADGVAKDMAVVTAQGLVGTVVSADEYGATVQLLLDPRSAVGSLVQRPESRVAAVVEGYAATAQQPRMVNIPRDADIIKGDTVVTSGFGGIYPQGIPVGEVLDVVNSEGGLLKYAVLQPAVHFDRLEEVQVIVRSRQPAPAPLAPAAPAATGLPGGKKP